MEKKAKRHQRRGPLDLLGQPSGKWDYKVYYTGTPYINISLEDIKLTGWGDDLEVDTRDDKKAKHDESYQVRSSPTVDPTSRSISRFLIRSDVDMRKTLLDRVSKKAFGTS